MNKKEVCLAKEVLIKKLEKIKNENNKNSKKVILMDKDNNIYSKTIKNTDKIVYYPDGEIYSEQVGNTIFYYKDKIIYKIEKLLKDKSIIYHFNYTGDIFSVKNLESVSIVVNDNIIYFRQYHLGKIILSYQRIKESDEYFLFGKVIKYNENLRLNEILNYNLEKLHSFQKDFYETGFLKVVKFYYKGYFLGNILEFDADGKLNKIYEINKKPKGEKYEKDKKKIKSEQGKKFIRTAKCLFS